MIVQMAGIPDSVKKRKATAGRVILAKGVSTGHDHSFSAKEVEGFDGPDNKEFFNVKGRDMDFALPAIRDWKRQVMVNHPDFGMIEFSKSDVSISENTVIVKGKFALLEHQEHTAIAVPSGHYSGGASNGRINQHEYSPERIRNVQD